MKLPAKFEVGEITENIHDGLLIDFGSVDLSKKTMHCYNIQLTNYMHSSIKAQLERCEPIVVNFEDRYLSD